MYCGDEFRPVTELCSEASYSIPEEQQQCNDTVEDYRSKLMGYCYNVQMTNPADEFCLAALPQPNMRTENILGDRARTHRLLVIPQFPVDFDDLPDLLQEAFDEDTYQAILNDEPFPGSEGYVSYGSWRGALRFGYDLLSIGGYDIDVEGENIPREKVGSTTQAQSRFGGSLEASHHWDLGLFLLTGAEYMINLTNFGTNIHVVDGLLGVGYQFPATDSFDLEFSLIAKLGYLFMDGLISHENVGPMDIANFDAALAGRISFVVHLSDHWRALIDIEGARTFTFAMDNGLEVMPSFPYAFFAKLGAAVI